MNDDTEKKPLSEHQFNRYKAVMPKNRTQKQAGYTEQPKVPEPTIADLERRIAMLKHPDSKIAEKWKQQLIRLKKLEFKMKLQDMSNKKTENLPPTTG